MFDISIVIPLFNEQDSLQELYERLTSSLKNYSFEILFIDDGSTDDSWKIIETLSKADSRVKAIQFRKNFGKTEALKSGFQEATGKIVVTMDADLQDLPEEIEGMYKFLIENDLDLVSGWKQNRKDAFLSKKLPSKFFNGVTRMVSGIHLHDFNCGLKVYKLEVVKSFNLHGDLHRFLPVLAKNEGFHKIAEKKVKHEARAYGVSKFGKKRFVNGFLDLLTLIFISKFGTRPMHFFGALGSLMFVFGFLSSFYIGINKLYRYFVLEREVRLVTENPLFYISLVCMIFGVQLFLAGFLGELLLEKSGRKNSLETVSQKFNL